MSVALRPTMSKLTLSTLLLVPAFGCIAGIGPADDETYTRTIVRIADDGSTTVTTEPVTATEQRLEHEAAIADARPGVKPLVAIDSCADWYATKFFDQPNYTGNELCLIGTGNGFLDQYCRLRLGPKAGCFRTWSEATRSLWTGGQTVWLDSVYYNSTCAGGVWSGLPAYEAYATVDGCVQGSDQFSLQPPQ
jgi:hypothetical protein